MATTTVNQERKKVISPNLEDTVSSSERGVYYVQNQWLVDSTNLKPVGVKQSITFPS